MKNSLIYLKKEADFKKNEDGIWFVKNGTKNKKVTINEACVFLCAKTSKQIVIDILKTFKSFKSLIDIEVINNKYIISIHAGEKKETDFRIKYSELLNETTWSKARQIKHIHWAADLLIKHSHNPKKTIEFARDICTEYQQVKTIKTIFQRNNVLACALNHCTKDTRKWKKLNKYGYYDIDFLYVIMYLLCICEKSAHKKAYKFKDLLNNFANNLNFFDFIGQATRRN